MTGLSGTFTAGQSTSSVTGTTIAGAAGTAVTSTYTTTWLEDQSVIGATAGNQTASTTPVTINAFNHANAVLTLTSPTTINAITGTTVNSSLTFANNGANNVALAIVTPDAGVTGLSGTFTAGQSTSSVTGTTVAGAAGTAVTSTYSTTWLEDQSIIGATAGNQTASATPVTINAFNHANGVLTLTSPATINAIAGATVNSSLTFSNNGANNDALAIVTPGAGVTGLSGTFTAGQSTSSVVGTTVAGAAGTTVTATYCTTWLEDQTVLGATAGNQTASATPVTINALGHANPILSVVGGNNQTVITGASVSASLCLSNPGTNLSPLDVGGLSANLSGASGTAVVSSGSATTYTGSLDTSTVGMALSQSFSLNAGDQQSLPGANPFSSPEPERDAQRVGPCQSAIERCRRQQSDRDHGGQRLRQPVPERSRREPLALGRRRPVGQPERR